MEVGAQTAEGFGHGRKGGFSGDPPGFQAFTLRQRAQGIDAQLALRLLRRVDRVVEVVQQESHPHADHRANHGGQRGVAHRLRADGRRRQLRRFENGDIVRVARHRQAEILGAAQLDGEADLVVGQLRLQRCQFHPAKIGQVLPVSQRNDGPLRLDGRGFQLSHLRFQLVQAGLVARLLLRHLLLDEHLGGRIRQRLRESRICVCRRDVDHRRIHNQSCAQIALHLPGVHL